MSTPHRRGLVLLVCLAAAPAGIAIAHARYVCWLGSLADGSAGQPCLQIDRCHGDLGAIDAGARPRVRFEIANTGTKRLILTRQSEDCQCTITTEPQTIVPPGRGAWLELEIPATGPGGAFQREFNYSTNDPRVPLLTLTVSGEIRPTTALPTDQR